MPYDKRKMKRTVFNEKIQEKAPKTEDRQRLNTEIMGVLTRENFPKSLKL